MGRRAVPMLYPWGRLQLAHGCTMKRLPCVLGYDPAAQHTTMYRLITQQ